MSKKKLTKTEIESNLLAENVRVLRCGLYGYIFKGEAILKSADLKEVNEFSKWVLVWTFHAKMNNYSELMENNIIREAKERQKQQDLFIKNELPNTTGERIVSKGNNWGAKVKIPN